MVPFGGSWGSFLPPCESSGELSGDISWLVKSFWIMDRSAGRGSGYGTQSPLGPRFSA